MTRPDPAARAAAAYRGAAGVRYHQGKRGVPDAAVPWIIRSRAKVLQPLVPTEGSVFEYGVGAGWNLAGLRCRERIGFDVTPELQSGLEARGIQFCLQSSDLRSEQFDVVVCHHTLEHVPDPVATLIELHRVTKPGGRLWLVVPFERGRRYHRFNPQEPNHHLFSWNAQTLGNLLQVAGWENFELRLARYGYDRAAAALAFRWRLGEPGFRLLRSVAQYSIPLWQVEVIGTRV